eukprot:COSAG01_NODE_13219_length_1617_cov_258.395916_1_plen_135_part_00
MYVRDSSMVTPYPLLLFGGEIVVRHEDMVIQVDGWIEFSSMGKVAVLIKQLRQELDRLLVRDALRWWEAPTICPRSTVALPVCLSVMSVAAVCHVCGIVDDSFRGGVGRWRRSTSPRWTSRTRRPKRHCKRLCS